MVALFLRTSILMTFVSGHPTRILQLCAPSCEHRFREYALCWQILTLHVCLQESCLDLFTPFIRNRFPKLYLFGILLPHVRTYHYLDATFDVAATWRRPVAGLLPRCVQMTYTYCSKDTGAVSSPLLGWGYNYVPHPLDCTLFAPYSFHMSALIAPDFELH